MNDKRLTKYLSLMQSSFKGGEKTRARKAYSKALSRSTKEFVHAIQTQDCDTILRLERIAQEYDFRNETSIVTQKLRIEALTGLHDIQRLWEKNKDPERIKKRFLGGLEGITVNPQRQRMKDTLVDAYVRTQSRRLGVFAGGTAVPAEKNFYNTRKAALQFFQKFNQEKIDKVMGFAAKSNEDLER